MIVCQRLPRAQIEYFQNRLLSKLFLMARWSFRRQRANMLGQLRDWKKYENLLKVSIAWLEIILKLLLLLKFHVSRRFNKGNVIDIWVRSVVFMDDCVADFIQVSINCVSIHRRCYVVTTDRNDYIPFMNLFDGHHAMSNCENVVLRYLREKL